MLTSGGNAPQLRSSYRVRIARSLSHDGGDRIHRYSLQGQAIPSAQAGIATQTLGSDVHAHPLCNFSHLVPGLDDLASCSDFTTIDRAVRPHVLCHLNGVQMAEPTH